MSQELPEHLKDLEKGPRGMGLEVFFVSEPGDKLWSGGFSMVYANGQPLGLVRNLELKFSEDGTHFELHLSQVIQMRNIHGVTQEQMELIAKARSEKTR